jgi:hypothetical protein
MTKNVPPTKDEIKRVRNIFKKVAPKPTLDKDCDWLRVQRPSRALLICLGSGPWKIGRRTSVQAKALEILGSRDLDELRPREIEAMFPLEWQRSYLKAFVKFSKKQTAFGFDKCWHTCMQDEDWREEQFNLIVLLTLGDVKVPKVISMFARDYCCIDSFPQDRHVRRFLIENKLPTNEKKLIELMNAARLNTRVYARSLFTSKSSNPQHQPSAKDWML